MAAAVLYETTAITVGGRSGSARTDDGTLDLSLARPREMGGAGGGTNPEQLFACGYSACFGGTLDFLASQKKLAVTRSAVTARVALLKDPAEGFGLRVHLLVELEGPTREQARELVDMAHRNCPYSRAIRGNVDVVVELR